MIKGIREIAGYGDIIRGRTSQKTKVARKIGNLDRLVF